MQTLLRAPPQGIDIQDALGSTPLHGSSLLVRRGEWLCWRPVVVAAFSLWTDLPERVQAQRPQNAVLVYGQAVVVAAGDMLDSHEADDRRRRGGFGELGGTELSVHIAAPGEDRSVFEQGRP